LAAWPIPSRKKVAENESCAKLKNLQPAILARAFEQALKARDVAYAPYSKFLVGAALVVKDSKERGGYKIVTGSNTENVVFQGTCAERNALGTAVGLGYRAKDIAAVIVVGGPKKANGLDSSVSPCGVCRQGLLEILSPETPMMHSIGTKERDVTELKIHTLEELLPFAFSPDALSKKNKLPMTFAELAKLKQEKQGQTKLDA